MTHRIVTAKVVCYVVRGEDLLVVRQLGDEAGGAALHVPSGTVRRGETPEQAALRGGPGGHGALLGGILT